MTPELVVLPRSGVVLTEFDRGIWKGPLSHLAAVGAFHMVSFAGQHGPKDLAERLAEDGIWRVRGDARERCIAWLDAKVIETRQALLPPGSAVVSAADRERIKEALRVALTGVTAEYASSEAMRDKVADAVLAAIGAGK